MDRWAWGAGAVLTGVCCLELAHFSHFTWWGILQFYLLCLLNAAGLGDRFVVAYVYQATLIIAGVAYMSAAGCAMLRLAAEEWSLAYLPLNFAVHFLPSLVAIAFAPRRSPCQPRAQLAFGGLTFVLYAAVNDGPRTYGCAVRQGYGPALVVAVTALLLLVPEHAMRVLVRPPAASIIR